LALTACFKDSAAKGKIYYRGVILFLIFTYAASGIVSFQHDNRYYAAQWLSENADLNKSIGMTLFVYVPGEFRNKVILTPDIQLLDKANYDYIILSSWEYERYLESPQMYPQKKVFTRDTFREFQI